MKRGHRPVIVQPQSGPTGAINVTPLVDVVLVLLIIFMVLTPLLEKSLAVHVPTPQPVPANEVSPDQIVVRIDEHGVLSVNGENVATEAYVALLGRRLERRPAKERVVVFSADDDADYAALVHAFDGARQAGAQALGMMTDAPGSATAALPGTAAAPPDSASAR